MSTTPTTYREKSAEVEAMQLTAENIRDVAIWADAKIIHLVDPRTMESFDGLELGSNFLRGASRVSPGEFVVREADGKFSRASAETMTEYYEEVAR